MILPKKWDACKKFKKGNCKEGQEIANSHKVDVCNILFECKLLKELVQQIWCSYVDIFLHIVTHIVYMSPISGHYYFTYFPSAGDPLFTVGYLTWEERFWCWECQNFDFMNTTCRSVNGTECIVFKETK